MMNRLQDIPRVLGYAMLLLGSVPVVSASDLHVGASTIDITPTRPVALDGQMHTRISEKAETPIFVTALALESREIAFVDQNFPAT